MAAGAGTKPASSARDKSNARLFAQLLAKFFCVLAEAANTRKSYIRPFRRMYGNSGPARQPFQHVIPLSAQVTNKVGEPVPPLLECRDDRHLRKNRNAEDSA